MLRFTVLDRVRGVLLRPPRTEAVPGGRDLRLDFFRGLALWFIFLDHVPSNALAWLTVRNYGFSDATEIFVFISGYTATVAYGEAMRREGFLYGGARILRRCWQVYIAHLVLFVVFTAQIAYTAARFKNPMFVEEMGIIGFINEPEIALGQALLLKFRPANLDVLPLYIALLAVFPVTLWFLLRFPRATLAGSFALYAAARVFDWNLPTYPEGEWVFNPLAWQFLFVLGGLCRRLQTANLWERLEPRVFVPLAGAWLFFAFFAVLSWSFPLLGGWIPLWLRVLLYPIDKTGLDPVRLLHFASLAYLTVRLVDAQAAFLRRSWARPLLLCGRHSLQIFCLGIFLSFAGHFILVQFNGSMIMQIGVSLSGLAIMSGWAMVMTWYDRVGAARKRGG